MHDVPKGILMTCMQYSPELQEESGYTVYSLITILSHFNSWYWFGGFIWWTMVSR